MFIPHMSSPVIFPGEELRTRYCLRILAASSCAVESLRTQVSRVDVSLKMGDGAETLVAGFAFLGFLVITHVVTSFG
jgi:hypothetical protein